MNTLPVAFIAAAISMILGQSWKIFSPVLKGKPPVFGNILQSGGMPSAHTAATASMALMTGLMEGFDSSVFAVALVLTAVVAHDAVKVRGSMNTIVRILKKTVAPEVLEEAGVLPDTVGHSVAEVIVGFILAAVVAIGCYFFLV